MNHVSQDTCHGCKQSFGDTPTENLVNAGRLLGGVFLMHRSCFWATRACWECKAPLGDTPEADIYSHKGTAEPNFSDLYWHRRCYEATHRVEPQAPEELEPIDRECDGCGDVVSDEDAVTCEGCEAVVHDNCLEDHLASCDGEITCYACEESMPLYNTESCEWCLSDVRLERYCETCLRKHRRTCAGKPIRQRRQ